MKFSDFNTYLIARFLFRYAKASVPGSFASLFQRNSEYHNHETRSANYFHIPAVTSVLGKTGIRFRGAIVWNAVLSNNVNTDVSGAVYVKFLKKRLINENVLPWIDGRIIIMYLESTQPCNHNLIKYVDHTMMSFSLVKMYSYCGVNSVVISQDVPLVIICIWI